MSATEKHLLIPKIESGVVIDHIPAGLGLRIVEIMRQWAGLEDAMLTLGLNLASTRAGTKDMVKLHDHQLPAAVVAQIALVSPGLTIKRVQDFRVVEKLVLQPPREIRDLAICRNPNCVTNREAGVRTHFKAVDPKASKFRCSFCERVFRLRHMQFTTPISA